MDNVNAFYLGEIFGVCLITTKQDTVLLHTFGVTYMNNFPIVFTHSGCQDYLKIAIRQTQAFNPESEIILLGDESNEVLKKICTHFFFKDFSSEADKFKRVYKPFSNNNVDYEYFCIKRWFLLLGFMKEKEIEWAFVCDTDVLLYCSVSKYYNQHIAKEYEAAFCIPDQEYSEFRWLASAHTSFISFNFLQRFCDYILDIYSSKIETLREKIKFHDKTNLPGGISDMSFFYLYYYYKNRNIFNLSNFADGTIFNINVDMKDGELNDKIQNNIFHGNLSFSNERPFTTGNRGQNVFFESLHFHGGSKYLMLKFYTGNTDLFVFKCKLVVFSKNYIGKLVKLIESRFK